MFVRAFFGSVFLGVFVAMGTPGAHAREPSAQSVSADPMLSGPDAEAAVAECLGNRTERVEMLSDGITLCWTAAIYPTDFLRFESLRTDAKRVVFSSRGGNVVTAMTLAARLTQLDLPVILAGRCVSACASVITPGITNARVHPTAYFLVHGITGLERGVFLDDYRWRKAPKEGEATPLESLSLAAEFAWNYYSVQWPRTLRFFEQRAIAHDYMREPDLRMLEAKSDLGCPLELMDYFAVLSRDHLRTFLGERLAMIEDFIDDPAALSDKEYLQPISADGVLAYKGALREQNCAP
jgi:hypothetical protein